LTITEDIWY